MIALDVSQQIVNTTIVRLLVLLVIIKTHVTILLLLPLTHVKLRKTVYHTAWVTSPQMLVTILYIPVVAKPNWLQLEVVELCLAKITSCTPWVYLHKDLRWSMFSTLTPSVTSQQSSFPLAEVPALPTSTYGSTTSFTLQTVVRVLASS